MSVPPELMALLQGGGAPAEAPAPEAEAPAPEGGLYGAGAPDNLKAAIDALDAYAREESDDKHVQTVLKCLQLLQSIQVEDTQMSDGLMSGKADQRALRRFAG